MANSSDFFVRQLSAELRQEQQPIANSVAALHNSAGLAAQQQQAQQTWGQFQGQLLPQYVYQQPAQLPGHHAPYNYQQAQQAWLDSLTPAHQGHAAPQYYGGAHYNLHAPMPSTPAAAMYHQYGYMVQQPAAPALTPYQYYGYAALPSSAAAPQHGSHHMQGMRAFPAGAPSAYPRRADMMNRAQATAPQHGHHAAQGASPGPAAPSAAGLPQVHGDPEVPDWATLQADMDFLGLPSAGDVTAASPQQAPSAPAASLLAELGEAFTAPSPAMSVLASIDYLPLGLPEAMSVEPASPPRRASEGSQAAAASAGTGTTMPATIDLTAEPAPTTIIAAPVLVDLTAKPRPLSPPRPKTGARDLYFGQRTYGWEDVGVQQAEARRKDRIDRAEREIFLEAAVTRRKITEAQRKAFRRLADREVGSLDAWLAWPGNADLVVRETPRILENLRLRRGEGQARRQAAREAEGQPATTVDNEVASQPATSLLSSALPAAAPGSQAGMTAENGAVASGEAPPLVSSAPPDWMLEFEEEEEWVDPGPLVIVHDPETLGRRAAGGLITPAAPFPAIRAPVIPPSSAFYTPPAPAPGASAPPAPTVPKKKGPGRPPGSKNRPKNNGEEKEKRPRKKQACKRKRSDYDDGDDAAESSAMGASQAVKCRWVDSEPSLHSRIDSGCSVLPATTTEAPPDDSLEAAFYAGFLAHDKNDNDELTVDRMMEMMEMMEEPENAEPSTQPTSESVGVLEAQEPEKPEEQEAAAESVTQPEPEPVVEPQPETAVEPATETATEPEPEPEPEPAAEVEATADEKNDDIDHLFEDNGDDISMDHLVEEKPATPPAAIPSLSLPGTLPPPAVRLLSLPGTLSLPMRPA